MSSERQLADGLTKVSARLAFTERYKGHHIQLVADESYQAAKKKSQAERRKTVQETQMPSSKVAQTLIGMVMTTGVAKASEVNKTWTEENKDSMVLFDMAMVVTILIGIFTMGWMAYMLIFKKKTDFEDEPMPELDPVDDGEKDDVMGNLVNDLWEKNDRLKTQVKELENKVSYLMGIIQKAEKKEHGTNVFFSLPQEVFTTPTGACFHTRINCGHIRGERQRWRLCKSCGG